MKVSFSFDALWYPRAESTDSWGLLGSFLVTELQGDESWKEYWGEWLQEAPELSQVEWEGSGNAHSVDISAGKATITNEYLSPEAILVLDLSQYVRVCEAWLKFTGVKSANTVVLDLTT